MTWIVAAKYLAEAISWVMVTVQGGAPEIPVERAATEWEVAALGLMAQGPAADAAGIHGPSPNSWRNACSRLTPCLAAVDR